MFLRKLMVMALPLLLVMALLIAFGALEPADFWGNAAFGLLAGLALSLLPLAGGATRRRVPFARLLWVPAALLTALVLLQGLKPELLPASLLIYKAAPLLLECGMAGALIGTALLG